MVTFPKYSFQILLAQPLKPICSEKFPTKCKLCSLETKKLLEGSTFLCWNYILYENSHLSWSASISSSCIRFCYILLHHIKPREITFWEGTQSVCNKKVSDRSQRDRKTDSDYEMERGSRGQRRPGFIALLQYSVKLRLFCRTMTNKSFNNLEHNRSMAIISFCHKPSTVWATITNLNQSPTHWSPTLIKSEMA